MKIAFAIPFMASKFTAGLQLCLKSIKKFAAGFDYKIFVQLDITNRNLYDKFSFFDVNSIVDGIRWNKIIRKQSGDYKQRLIDWVMEETDADYVIVLHSDVFFTDSKPLSLLLDPLIKNSNSIASYWVVPLVKYTSTFHREEQSKKEFLVAPRIASWLFALNRKIYLEWTKGKNERLFLGHYWIKKRIFPDECLTLKPWLMENGKFIFDKKNELDCLVDIGTFFRWFIESNNIRVNVLGQKENPNFSSLKLQSQREGFIHIEQYDPERFDDKFYDKSLLEKRTAVLEDILRKYY